MECVCTSQDCSQSECVELTTRELTICNVICDSDHPVSFTQVRQATDLHQEIISRVVHRLAIHGLVSKVDGGYQGHCRR